MECYEYLVVKTQQRKWDDYNGHHSFWSNVFMKQWNREKKHEQMRAKNENLKIGNKLDYSLKPQWISYRTFMISVFLEAGLI